MNLKEYFNNMVTSNQEIKNIIKPLTLKIVGTESHHGLPINHLVCGVNGQIDLEQATDGNHRVYGLHPQGNFLSFVDLEPVTVNRALLDIQINKLKKEANKILTKVSKLQELYEAAEGNAHTNTINIEEVKFRKIVEHMENKKGMTQKQKIEYLKKALSEELPESSDLHEQVDDEELSLEAPVPPNAYYVGMDAVGTARGHIKIPRPSVLSAYPVGFNAEYSNSKEKVQTTREPEQLPDGF